MSSSVGGRHLDLALLWLWHRWVAAALIQPLAWESPYATGVVLKRKKRRKKKKTFPENLTIRRCFLPVLPEHIMPHA